MRLGFHVEDMIDIKKPCYVGQIDDDLDLLWEVLLNPEETECFANKEESIYGRKLWPQQSPG